MSPLCTDTYTYFKNMTRTEVHEKKKTTGYFYR